MNSKITIRDVASLANVSVKTVSRVLNNEPNVRIAMQERVNAAVKELNFKPNPQARGLRGNKSFILTLIYSNPNPDYILEVQKGILDQGHEDGYNLQILPCDHTSENLIEMVTSFLEGSPQDGVILTLPLSDNQQIIELLESKNIPYTRISPLNSESNSPFVGSDDQKAAYDMTRHLISLGHTDIAFIKGHPDHSDTHKRLLGYKQALNEYGINANEQFIKQGYFTFESGEYCARQLLSQPIKPTAIFASNDCMAAGVLKVSKQLNISVPAMLTIAGYDDTSVSQQVWPAITTVKQPIYQLGKLATKKLINKIKSLDYEKLPSILECDLVLRESASPCSAIPRRILAHEVI
ncbi:LacI family DNA-binding transcriptional regulator [Thalassotalea crassostreae]|uniref:LacI family DNA-binding transcriptional regulator n=1 Tax=Thalassotalea crassostreae TaxID=1763536 RepID=UPI001D04B633|nr:LacI family DNA-binding transcriptional regulator [Thalassotalea crassostreae]